MASKTTESCFHLFRLAPFHLMGQKLKTVKQWKPNDGKKENRGNSYLRKVLAVIVEALLFRRDIHVDKTYWQSSFKPRLHFCSLSASSFANHKRRIQLMSSMC